LILADIGLDSCSCPNILIVDDEPFNIIALQGLLLQIGITKVEKAFNGEEALKKIKEN
jgi:CheY-like chemotaxis protein